VDLHELPRAGRGVQAVDVLGDHRVEESATLELGEDGVRAVGALVAERLEAVAVEAPEARGLTAEHVDVRDLHRVDPLPQAGSGRAEVGDPRGHGDPRPGEGDDRPRRADEVGEALPHLPWK